MRLIVDAQLPPALAAWLRARGHDARGVREIGLRDASDAAIWARALADGAVIVTKDEDFAQLATTSTPAPAILWVRTGNLLNDPLLQRFAQAWPAIEQHLEGGARLVELR